MRLKQYFRFKQWTAFLLLIGILSSAALGNQSPAEEPNKLVSSEKVLIDDFGYSAPISRLGSKWNFITDREMGGASTGRMEFVQHERQSCLHMTGSVSLRNNRGFIKARTNLNTKAKPFDARGFKGIYLRAKGNGQQYAVHLRTKDNRRPLQFYQARFRTNKTWQEVRIPFRRFKPTGINKPLNTKLLKSVAVVAANKEFKVDIFVDEIGLYKESNMHKKLTPEEERIIVQKGTELPFSGKFHNHFESGIYTCKRCGEALFESSTKFKSACGWPSFDDQIEGAVKWQRDVDGVRTEIVCANCQGHLGHVFRGEGLTAKNIRHCVNSLSMNFIPANERKAAKAIFASGCFWGTEYHFRKAPGVISTSVGYTGGQVDNPTYKQVCTDKTGHAEGVEVIYDPSKTTYEQLAKLFFETHDFTQLNRQGPDIGTQYRSVVFYLDEQQKQIATKLVKILQKKGYDVKTDIKPASKFWPGEEYHQDYYQKSKKKPYCHFYKKKF